MGDPRPATPTARHRLAAGRATPDGSGNVPLASDTPCGDAGRDKSAAAGALHTTPTTAPTGPGWPEVWPGVFDTAHATELYPELAPLHGWSWSWMGTGTTTQLIGYHAVGVGAAVEMLYLDSDTHATVTRTTVSGKLSVHQSGDLTTILTLLAADETDA